MGAGRGRERPEDPIRRLASEVGAERVEIQRSASFSPRAGRPDPQALGSRCLSQHLGGRSFPLGTRDPFNQRPVQRLI